MREARERVVRLYEAAQARKFDEVEQQAHTLKSIMGNVGARAASETASEIMEACRLRHFDNLVSMSDQLTAGAETAIAALKRRYAGWGAAA